MNKTEIQWTWAVDPVTGALIPRSGFTWNPLVGCRRVSKGCGVPGGGSCYAERIIATRLSQHPIYKGLAVMRDHGPQFTGEHRLIAVRLDEPLRKRNPQGGRTFVCDLGDMFFEDHTFDEIAAVWGVMAAAPHHTFQVLTKRPKRMAEFFAWLDKRHTAVVGSTHVDVCTAEAVNAGLKGHHLLMLETSKSTVWPLPNVWLGTSTEDQDTANARIPWLLRCPAPVRFLSIEPQCGPVDLVDAIGLARLDMDTLGDPDVGIHWVIDGGWSGPGAGPFDLAWTRSTQAQCKEAGVAYFRKQLGARPVEQRPFGGPMHLSLADSHGGDESEWPADLRGARAFPVLP